MPEVNVALIGYAFMGKAHSNAYRQVSHFFSPRLTPRLKVLCGRTLKNVRAAAETFGFDDAATDWREVVRRKDIHIVDVSTPGDSHAEIAIAAARAGKVVICEKPLANSVKDAERMLAAVQKAGVLHMVCHNYRRIPAVMLAKQLIDEGRLGTIRHFRGTYLQDWIVDPQFPLVWRLDKAKAGSGALGDIGSPRRSISRDSWSARSRKWPARSRHSSRSGRCPDNPKQKGRVTVDDAATARGAVRERRAGPDRGDADGDRAQELQPLRDQRQQGQHRVRPRAHERARGVLRRRSEERPGLPHDSGDRGRASVHEGVVAAWAI